MTAPLAIVNALEAYRAGRERREPEPEFVLRPDASVEKRRVEDDHSLVDETDGEIGDGN